MKRKQRMGKVFFNVIFFYFVLNLFIPSHALTLLKYAIQRTEIFILIASPLHTDKHPHSLALKQKCHPRKSVIFTKLAYVVHVLSI